MSRWSFLLLLSLTPMITQAAQLVCKAPIILSGTPGPVGDGLLATASPACELIDRRFAGRFVRYRPKTLRTVQRQYEKELTKLLEGYDFAALETKVNRWRSRTVRTPKEALRRSVALGFRVILLATSGRTTVADKAMIELRAYEPGFVGHRDPWLRWLPARWRGGVQKNRGSGQRYSLWVNGATASLGADKIVRGVVAQKGNPKGILLYKPLAVQRVVPLLRGISGKALLLDISADGRCSGAWRGPCDALRIVAPEPVPVVNRSPDPVSSVVLAVTESPAKVVETHPSATQRADAKDIVSVDAVAVDVVPKQVPVERLLPDPLQGVTPVVPSHDKEAPHPRRLWPWLAAGGAVATGVIGATIYLLLPRPSGIEVHW